MNKISEFKGEYSWLSNFWYVDIKDPVLVNAVYPTSEHAFQAMKTTQLIQRNLFLVPTSMTPGQAKRMGRKVSIRDNWEDIKLSVMHTLLEIKFSDPELRQKLLDTGNMVIEEGNWWGDKFWGICLKTGEGLNHLGKILMTIREEIRNEQQ
ncbi:MAG: NADAR family protein [Methylophaga sp.]|nr:NADAR family protein [Methylophaga sp.]